MKRHFLAIAFIISLCITVNGQQPSTPDDGGVKDGIYTNNYFGFSVAHPAGWVVHGEATNEHLKELSKERAKATGVLSAAESEVLLKKTYQLLTTFRYPLGTPIAEMNSGFAIVAESVKHAPGIINGRDYLAATRQLLVKMGAQPIQDEPVEMNLSGHKFFRVDAVLNVNGQTVHETIVVSIEKGFALAFLLTGKDPQAVGQAARALSTLKFTNATSPKQ